MAVVAEPRHYWSRREIAEYLGVTYAGVAVTDLPDPAVRVGKQLGWDPEEVRAWAAEREARALASGDRRYAANRMSLAEAEARAARLCD